MSKDFADYVVDLLRPLGPIRAKRMFGGFGLFLDGLMFALIIDGTLYFKADAVNRPIFNSRQMTPFEYLRQGWLVALSYLAAPAEALEDEEDLLALAKLGFEAALRGRKKSG